MDIVITLVFSIVMLIFMIYPAMVTTRFIINQDIISSKYENFSTVFFTLLYSLVIGIFLKYL